MKNIIHICFSPCEGFCLRVAIRKEKLFEGKNIVEFPDDISMGTIESDINIDKRIEWWNSINKDVKKLQSQEYDELKESYKQFHKEISKIKNSDIIYLWYGESSSEMCGLMYTLGFLKDKIENMYFINVSEKVDETNNKICRALSDVEIKELEEFIKIKRKVELKEYDDLINQWNSLKKDNSLLRVLKDGKVRSVREDYYDINILKYMPKDFRISTRIVGRTGYRGYSETGLSNDYIFWRIQEFVNSGILEYKGKFGVMREMEIKITQKGLEYLSTNSDAMLFWENNEEEIKVERAAINEAKEQGRIEEKISMAKKLMDVLDIDIIAKKTGLTVMQVKNLKVI